MPEIHLIQEFSKTGLGVSIEKYCFALFDEQYWVAIIIMEKIDGVLEDIMKGQNILPQTTINDICTQIIQIINELDHNNIHHCDLNFGNIGYVHRPDGGYQLKLIDFGLGVKGNNFRNLDVLSLLKYVLNGYYDNNPNVQKIRNYLQHIGNHVLRLPDDDLRNIIDQHGNFDGKKVYERFDLHYEGPVYAHQTSEIVRQSIQFEASQLSPTITGAKSPFHDVIITSLKTRSKRPAPPPPPRDTINTTQPTTKRPRIK
jgi:serine/threonine protein kinase